MYQIPIGWLMKIEGLETSPFLQGNDDRWLYQSPAQTYISQMTSSWIPWSQLDWASSMPSYVGWSKTPKGEDMLRKHEKTEV